MTRRPRNEPVPAPEPAEARPRSRASLVWEAAIVILALVAGTGLRLYWTAPETLWLDEAYTAVTSARSPAEIVEAVREDGNPPLYYFLVHVWLKVFGDGEEGLRILSGIFASLLPVGLYLAGRALLGRTAGLVAAVIGAFSPLNVFYAHEVRMYALVPVLSLAFIAALMAALGRDSGTSWKRWALVAAAAIPMIWTYTFGRILLAAIPFAWCLRGPRNRVVAARAAVTLVAIGVIDLVWIPSILHQSGQSASDWIASYFHADRAPFESLMLFGAGYHYPQYLRILGGESPVAWVAVVWMIAALAASSWFGLRDRTLRGSFLTLVSVLLAGIGLHWALAVVARPIYLVGRHELGAYPAFALLLATGAQAAIRGVRKPRGAVIAIAAMLVVYVGLSVASFRLQFRPRKPMRLEERVASIVAKESKPGDVIIATGLTRAPFEYYWKRTGTPERLLESWPAELAVHMGWIDGMGMRRRSSELDREIGELLTRLKGGEGSVILVEDALDADVEFVTSKLKAKLGEHAESTSVLFKLTLKGSKTPFYEVTKYDLRRT